MNSHARIIEISKYIHVVVNGQTIPLETDAMIENHVASIDSLRELVIASLELNALVFSPFNCTVSAADKFFLSAKSMIVDQLQSVIEEVS